MAFGQQSGPPATARQVQELLELLRGAGHADFRDARGPMGFTQRQAGGKFTRDEAEGLIDRLQAELDGPPPPDAPAAPSPQDRAPATAVRPAPLPADDRMLRRLPDVQLATELERRGWIVIPP